MRATAWPNCTSFNGNLSRSKSNMTLVVGHFAITEPLPQAVSKISIGNFHSGTVFDAHFISDPFRFSIPTNPGQVPLSWPP